MAEYEDFGGGTPGGGYFDEPPQPPTIGDVLEAIKRRLPLILGILALLLAVGLGYDAFYQVEPEEEAIVLRFGKPTGEVFGPGLHTKIPLVDREYVVPVQTQHRIEFGFRSDPGKETVVREEGYDRESLMLTGDLLLVHVRWSVIYRIDDIETWLFNVRDREDTIRDVAMAVMRQHVGDYSLHEILTTKVRELQELAMRATQKALRENVPTGVVITELSIRSTDVPAGAKQAFDEFNRTEPDVSRKLAEAKADQHNVTGDAEQQKKIAIGKAEKRQAEIVKNAEGEALAFGAKLFEYKKAPEITRQWMYLGTMTRVLGGVEEKLLIDESGGGGALKLLSLTELLGAGRGAAPAPKAAVPAGGAR